MLSRASHGSTHPVAEEAESSKIGHILILSLHTDTHRERQKALVDEIIKLKNQESTVRIHAAVQTKEEKRDENETASCQDRNKVEVGITSAH